MAIDKGIIRKFAIKQLNTNYCDCWAQNNTRVVPGRTFTGRKGVPDIIGYHTKTGLMVVCEVKTEKDTLSPEQMGLLQSVHDAGGIALIAYESSQGNILVIDYVKYIMLKK